MRSKSTHRQGTYLRLPRIASITSSVDTSSRIMTSALCICASRAESAICARKGRRTSSGRERLAAHLVALQDASDRPLVRPRQWHSRVDGNAARRFGLEDEVGRRAVETNADLLQLVLELLSLLVAPVVRDESGELDEVSPKRWALLGHVEHHLREQQVCEGQCSIAGGKVIPDTHHYQVRCL